MANGINHSNTKASYHRQYAGIRKPRIRKQPTQSVQPEGQEQHLVAQNW